MKFFHFDFLRAIALLMIMTIHSMGLLDEKAVESTLVSYKIFSALIHGIIGCGVPLFVMLSGTLLIGKDEPLNIFFKKRTLRILPPFFIWSLVVFSIYSFQGKFGITSVNDFVIGFFKRLMSNQIHGIFWYVHLIIGLYILVPLLRKINQGGGLAYAFIVLTLMWVVKELGFDFPIFNWFTPSHVFYMCFFIGGYLIGNVDYLKNRKTVATTVFVICYALSFLSIYCHEKNSLVSFVLPFSCFLMIKAWKEQINNLPVKLKQRVSFVGKISYGVYLSHFIFISVLLKIGVQNYFPLWVEPFALVFLVLFVESVIFYGLIKIKIAKWMM